tara:strand:+ start:1191 stop:1325 length:135 start_codon:yes stop_codon:yes gene_type:complete
MWDEFLDLAVSWLVRSFKTGIDQVGDDVLQRSMNFLLTSWAVSL